MWHPLWIASPYFDDIVLITKQYLQSSHMEARERSESNVWYLYVQPYKTVNYIVAASSNSFSWRCLDYKATIYIFNPLMWRLKSGVNPVCEVEGQKKGQTTRIIHGPNTVEWVCITSHGEKGREWGTTKPCLQVWGAKDGQTIWIFELLTSFCSCPSYQWGPH